jgi:glutaredoxin 2
MILGVINSLIISNWLNTKFGSNDRVLFPRVIVKNIESLPIPKSREYDTKISKSAKKLSTLYQKLSTATKKSDVYDVIMDEIAFEQSELDSNVYKAFGI